MVVPIIIFWVVIWGLLGLVIGQRRNQSPIGAILISALFGPIGLLIVAVNTPDKKVIAKKEKAEGLRKCPFCAEMIKSEAMVCRFCSRDVPATA